MSRRPAPFSVTIAPPVGLGRDTTARQAARTALARVLWNADGTRRLPSDKALRTALAACDPRDIWWVCEASSAGPIYLLPTREWMTALARCLDQQRARTVLELGAGDGFLSACLRQVRPGLKVFATDSMAWRTPAARMNAADRKRYKSVPFQGIQPAAHVIKLGARAAVKKFKPDVVLISWAPPGTLVEEAITAPSKLVLDIGVDGDVCGNGPATWRFNKEFLGGPLEDRAWCRLDRPNDTERATRVTLYYGRAHAEYFEDDAG